MTSIELAARTRGCCVDIALPLPAERVDALAGVFRALADPTRLQMLRMLSDAAQPICVCDFTAAFAQSQPTISHHLGKLREAGFVRSEKRGIWSFHSLREDMPAACAAALALLG
ncbi:MAG TPA: metalloregulator ArsR/SmtB family transcription factor [Candidatus Dormibacteraeota bacterium]|nr:metalloregulator ArsR/SmtB family transcription factor [Candidatus Dormibacteraeota bacterium]